MHTSTFSCDTCGHDLTSAERPAWRLALTPERLTVVNPSGHCPAVLVTPPITRPHHFCDLRCLSEWLASLTNSGFSPPQATGL